MSEPVTTFDDEYSSPDAVAVSWEETRQVLETAELFWSALCDQMVGRTPLRWSQSGRRMQSGFDRICRTKYANLNANPQVVLITGCKSGKPAGRHR